jgi:hypothetical protein
MQCELCGQYCHLLDKWLHLQEPAGSVLQGRRESWPDVFLQRPSNTTTGRATTTTATSSCSVDCPALCQW